MKPEKRNKYQMIPSIHTLEVKCDADALQEIEKTKTEFMDISIDGKRDIATIKLNANNYEGDLFTFEHFYNVLEYIMLFELGVEKYKITRADLRLDSEDPTHYKDFQKLNRFLISALAVVYEVRNCYKANNLFTENQISVAIKGHHFEMEHYDRKYKNEVSGNQKNQTCSRLELRTISKQFSRFIKDFQEHEENMRVLKKEFCTYWIERLHKATAPESLEKVEQKYNAELLREYRSDKISKTLNEFMRKNEQRIFTSRQLKSLLMQIGKTEKQASTFARNFINRNVGIELLKISDVKYAVSVIEKLIYQFFR